MTYKHDDGQLILAEWGKLAAMPSAARSILGVSHLERPVAMYGTQASGQRMVSNGELGVDLIRVPAGEGFSPHTHPGDHLLIAVAGHGTVTVDGRIYPTKAGQVYMVEGAVPHAVGAITDHVILAVGAPHRNIDAADRMTLTDYAAVAASLGELTCLVCDGQPSGTADVLRAAGCTHAPAEAPTTRPLVVGLAPATEDYAATGLRPFEHTPGGDRLAALLDVAVDRLLEVVDAVNLSPHYLPNWQQVPVGRWTKLADENVTPTVAGRVVVMAGPTVTEAMGVWRFGPGVASVVSHDLGPWLAVSIPHPTSIPTDSETLTRTAAALRLAVNLAKTGPARGVWSSTDADAFNEAAQRVAADLLTIGPNVG